MLSAQNEPKMQKKPIRDGGGPYKHKHKIVITISHRVYSVCENIKYN